MRPLPLGKVSFVPETHQEQLLRKEAERQQALKKEILRHNPKIDNNIVRGYN